MYNFKFRPIYICDIPEMTDLLINRQDLESELFPFLKNSCLNEKAVAERLEKIFIEGRIIGIGAFIKEKLVGYILGEIKIDTRRGRYASVPYEGIAIRSDQSSEIIRYLYARVSVLWLEQGCFSHSILVPIANNAYYDALVRLSFAIEQVHAILDMNDYIPFENVADVDVRIANEKDSDLLANMSSIISEFQNSAPVFTPALPEVVESIKEGFRRLLEDDNNTVFIAEKDKQGIGFHDYEIITPNLMIPDNTIELCVAGVYSSKMRKGVGKKLMNESCQIVKDRGYSCIKTDWRITNLASSTFWPKCGFKPVAYRMARYIDSRYAWANFKNWSAIESCI